MTLSEKSQNIKCSSLEEYRPKELDGVFVTYDEGKRKVTCFCGEEVMHSIVPHFRKVHGDLWDKWNKLFVELSNLGYSWKDIMRLFSAGDKKLLFSWTVVEKTIRGEVEAGKIEYNPKPKKEIKNWTPVNFIPEKTTVWDFPQRGNWAVHSGDYRGNWPPQIPRNLIERYTNKGDLVVDAFAGGGTTIIEAWLLGRRSVGMDISKLAYQTMKAKLKEMEELAGKGSGISLHSEYRPIIVNPTDANALRLSRVLQKLNIRPNTVKLVCAHPPYLDCVKYTISNQDDLALVSNPQVFYEKMREFAREVSKVITPDGTCAILIGDVRKGGEVIPLGLKTIDSFFSEGLKLDNIVVKTQHRDKSHEFWVSHKSKIMLMAHEYLLIFKHK